MVGDGSIGLVLRLDAESTGRTVEAKQLDLDLAYRKASNTRTTGVRIPANRHPAAVCLCPNRKAMMIPRIMVRMKLTVIATTNHFMGVDERVTGSEPLSPRPVWIVDK